MDIGLTLSALTSNITVLTSELIGQIAASLDAWDVGHLFCCGGSRLNKLLLSTSCIRRMTCDSSDRPFFALPNFVLGLKGMKSLVLRRKDEPIVLQSSKWEFLKTLSRSLEELTLSSLLFIDECGTLFTNSETEGTSDFALDWPKLTSLELKSFKSLFDSSSLDLSVLPRNLTRLILKTELKTCNLEHLSNLPPMLVDLHLEVAKVSLLGCWIRKYPSLTALHLDALGKLSFDCDGILSLPRNLVRLSFGETYEFKCLDLPGEDLSWSKIEECKTTDFFIFKNLPPQLSHLCYQGQYCGKWLNELSCWSSLRHLKLKAAESIQQLPNLVYLELLGGHQKISSSIAYHTCTSTLHTLNFKDWSPTPLHLSQIPNLKRLICGTVIEKHLPHLPPSLTYLQVRSISKYNTERSWKKTADTPNTDAIYDLASWMRRLPDGNLAEVSHNRWWTWIRVSTIPQRTFNDARTIFRQSEDTFTFSELVDDESMEPMPFGGLDGSGWTSVGHAISLDSVTLLLEILHLRPSLWLEVRSFRALRVAVLHNSRRILQWLDSQHLVKPWADSIESPRDAFSVVSLRMVARLQENRDLEDWLRDRGFDMENSQMMEDPFAHAINPTNLAMLRPVDAPIVQNLD